MAAELGAAVALFRGREVNGQHFFFPSPSPPFPILPSPCPVLTVVESISGGQLASPLAVLDGRPEGVVNTYREATAPARRAGRAALDSIVTDAVCEKERPSVLRGGPD